jgi:hypothetical protein
MESSLALLRAVIDRIIPADDAPGALALGSDRFVVARLAEDESDRALVEAGLGLLAPDFLAAPPDRQDQLLSQVEGQPWFLRLVELVAEGFYADPDNGGNAGAASWTMIGYRPGLPEGPSGPARQGRTP